MSISRHCTVVVSRDQVSCNLQDEIAILSMKNGVYYGLDPVGARVWNLIQQPRTVHQVLSTILDEYDVDEERCEDDLLKLLQDLAEQGLIDVHHETVA